MPVKNWDQEYINTCSEYTIHMNIEQIVKIVKIVKMKVCITKTLEFYSRHNLNKFFCSCKICILFI